MKIDFYIDIFPGMKPEFLCVVQTPGAKAENSKRYKATINIPDHAFTGIIDGQAPVEDVVEVDRDENQ